MNQVSFQLKSTKEINTIAHYLKQFYTLSMWYLPGADPDKNMTFSKPIMTDMPRPFPGNAQEIDFSVLGV